MYGREGTERMTTVGFRTRLMTVGDPYTRTSGDGTGRATVISNSADAAGDPVYESERSGRLMTNVSNSTVVHEAAGGNRIDAMTNDGFPYDLRVLLRAIILVMPFLPTTKAASRCASIGDLLSRQTGHPITALTTIAIAVSVRSLPRLHGIQLTL